MKIHIRNGFILGTLPAATPIFCSHTCCKITTMRHTRIRTHTHVSTPPLKSMCCIELDTTVGCCSNYNTWTFKHETNTKYFSYVTQHHHSLVTQDTGLIHDSLFTVFLFFGEPITPDNQKQKRGRVNVQTLSSLLRSRICPITFCTGPFFVRYFRRRSSSSCETWERKIDDNEHTKQLHERNRCRWLTVYICTESSTTLFFRRQKI